MDKKTPILTVKGLKQYFKAGGKIIKAVDDVSFDIYPGETFGLVGESGSGKSTIGKSIIRLLDPTEGEIDFMGVNISGKLSKENEKFLRMNMQMIFQDPMACLNPSKCIGEIVGEGLDIQKVCKSRQERRERIEEALLTVGINPAFYNRLPSQFSGGQRQRVGIARALIMKPSLVIADECISALDVSVQAQVINLLKDIQEQAGTAFLFIAHDLSMVKYISHRIGVLYLGQMVETGTTDEIFANPKHSYTKNLLDTIPSLNPIE